MNEFFTYFSFFKFLQELYTYFKEFKKTMSVLSDRITTVINFLLSERERLLNQVAGAAQELATAKDALAVALGNDAADKAAIEAAQTEAANAKVLADQALIARDAALEQVQPLTTALAQQTADDVIFDQQAARVEALINPPV